MVSKKDAITLGMLAVAGVGGAMVIAGGGADDDLSGGAIDKQGGILGGFEQRPAISGTGTTIYQIPAEGKVTFPKAPRWDLKRMFDLAPSAEPAKSGVSAAPKKVGVLAPSPATGVRPYLYTGGEVGLGAYTLPPSPVTGVKPYLYTEGEVKPGAFSVVSGRGRDSSSYHAGRSKKESAMTSRTYERLSK